MSTSYSSPFRASSNGQAEPGAIELEHLPVPPTWQKRLAKTWVNSVLN